jgi:hypothetical protein
MEYVGTVSNGVIVLENNGTLPDGTRVRVSVMEPRPASETLGQWLMRFAGTVKGLPSDMAENHDHYLHGQPKK